MGSKVALRGELMFPSQYLSAIDLRGQDVEVQISAVSFGDLQMVGGAKARKPVMSFQGKQKRLVLNKTNAESIAAQYGTKAEAWVGKKITIYPTRTRFGSKVVDCIRVKEPNSNPDSYEPSGGDFFSEGSEPDSSQLMAKDEDTVNSGTAPDPDVEQHEESPTLDRLPSTLPDEARKDLNWLTKHVLGSNRPAGATTVVQTLKAFKAKLGVNSWEKLSPSQQDGIYTALMTDSFWS